MRTPPVLALLLSVCFGCAPTEEPVEDSERAKDLLNQGEYDQAIAVLKPLVGRENTSEARVLLASAYAGSVGFNVIDAYAIFEPAIFSQKPAAGSPSAGDADSSPVTDATNSHGKDGVAFVKDVQEFLDSYTQVFGHLANVPYTPIVERGRLVEALNVLRPVADDDPYFVRAHAYAGVLNILQFLNYMRDSIGQGTDEMPRSFIRAYCGLEVRTFVDAYDVTSTYLIDGAGELARAYARSRQSVADALLQLRSTALKSRTTFREHRANLGTLQAAITASKGNVCAE